MLMRGADLKQRLQPLVDDALAKGRCLGVLLLGVQGLRHFNIQHGYERGERLVSLVLSLVREALRPGDQVMVVAPGEMLVLLPGLRDVPHAQLAASRLLRQFASPLDVLGLPVLANVAVGIATALADLNAALHAHAPAAPFPVTEGARKGQKLALGSKGQDLHEWEVPFDLPPDWPAALHAPLAAFHTARQKMQAEMDRSIASNADNETLYDQPERDKAKLRVCGPFTVEAVPFPTVLSLEELPAQAGQAQGADLADMSLARSGHTSRQHTWRDELLKTGIRGKGGQMLRFAELEVLPGTTSVHASGSLDTGERVVVSFGPEHGALEQRQVERALSEASELFPRPKMIVFCAFAFDPEAAKDIDALKGITALKAQMNTDLLTEDLKKARSSNQSFWLMGQPDVLLTPTKDGLWQVEVNGFDYFDTAKGELVSGGKAKIAAWQLDTDYDGRSLFPHQVFFPMAGKDEGWMKLKKDIRAELDAELLQAFTGTVSLPFAAGDNRMVAVKIVDDRGIESLKVMRLDASTQGGQ